MLASTNNKILLPGFGHLLRQAEASREPKDGHHRSASSYWRANCAPHAVPAGPIVLAHLSREVSDVAERRGQQNTCRIIRPSEDGAEETAEELSFVSGHTGRLWIYAIPPEALAGM